MKEHAEPVGGPLITPFTRFLLIVIGIWAVVLVWRFAAGIGAVTALNDGYPFGLWIAFDVVTAMAMACGGFSIALLTYVLNKGEYHPLIRPALLTSALGYSLGALAIIIDVGRPWYIYRIPIRVGQWNLNSPLLEVALCVMAYVGVLWIEMSPAFMERWKETHSPGLRSFAEKGLRFFDKALVWIVALGILLPTMHQSSLGTVILLGGPKLHPLWNTPLVPLLFLISCIGMGYAVVVFEGALAARLFKRKREDEMLAHLGGVMALLTGLFLVIRFVDLLLRGRLGQMFRDGYSLLFWIEMAVFAVPMIMLWRNRGSFRTVFQASMLLLLAGGLYRFDSYLVAFNPGPQWSYFPILPELIVSVGMVVLEIFLYVWFVKRFPILPGGSSAEKA